MLRADTAEDVCVHCATLCLVGGAPLGGMGTPSLEASVASALSLFRRVATLSKRTTTRHRWTPDALADPNHPVIVKPSRRFHTSTTRSTRRSPRGSKDELHKHEHGSDPQT